MSRLVRYAYWQVDWRAFFPSAQGRHNKSSFCVWSLARACPSRKRSLWNIHGCLCSCCSVRWLGEMRQSIYLVYYFSCHFFLCRRWRWTGRALRAVSRRETRRVSTCFWQLLEQTFHVSSFSSFFFAFSFSPFRACWFAKRSSSTRSSTQILVAWAVKLSRLRWLYSCGILPVEYPEQVAYFFF